MTKLMTLLTAALSLGTPTDTQATALQTWAETHLPPLVASAQALLKPPFTLQELSDLADEAVTAAQDLKGIFEGTERAQAAQIILVVAAREALPDLVEPWVIPFLSGDGVEALIESAFQRVFGPEVVALPPITDAPELPSGDPDSPTP